MITRVPRNTIAMIAALMGPWIKKRENDERTKQQATDAYFERMSMRGVERVFAVPRKRLAEWLIEEAESLPDLSTTLAEVQENDVWTSYAILRPLSLS